MARLEACYFCGAAEDAPLREVTVTPRRRRDDPDAAVTLTLCRSCEGKLERVLGGLFEHVESRQSDEPSGADPAAEPADEPTADEPEHREEPAAEPVDRIDVAPSRSTPGRRRLFTDPDLREVGSAAAEDDGEAEAVDEADDAEIIEEDEGPKVTARATAGSKPDLDGVSVAEYNRVMRLLQNREFPMERGAFVDLAASAYDLAEDTVDTVLDAVIDQGALDERDGELVRPGGGGGP